MECWRVVLGGNFCGLHSSVSGPAGSILSRRMDDPGLKKQLQFCLCSSWLFPHLCRCLIVSFTARVFTRAFIPVRTFATFRKSKPSCRCLSSPSVCLSEQRRRGSAVCVSMSLSCRTKQKPSRYKTEQPPCRYLETDQNVPK